MVHARLALSVIERTLNPKPQGPSRFPSCQKCVKTQGFQPPARKTQRFCPCLARSWAPRLQNASVAPILNCNSLSQALLGVPRRSQALPSAHRRTQRGPRRNPKPRARAFRRIVGASSFIYSLLQIGLFGTFPGSDRPGGCPGAVLRKNAAFFSPGPRAYFQHFRANCGRNFFDFFPAANRHV